MIGDKRVYTELDELVDAAHTALILVDMQRDFIEPQGAFARRGVDVGMYPNMRARLNLLLAQAREHRLLVVHLQNTALPGYRSDSPAQLRFNLLMHARERDGAEPLLYTVLGDPGHEFVPEMTPKDGEVVVRKYRSSGFWGTELDLVLRSNGIESVVMTGCTTEGCVESTARDAMFNNYYVVVAEDCVASDDPAQHEASLLLMRHRFDLFSGENIAAAWSRTRLQNE